VFQNLFCKHYISPLNTFMRREGSGAGSGSILHTNGSGSGRQKTCGSGSSILCNKALSILLRMWGNTVLPLGISSGMVGIPLGARLWDHAVHAKQGRKELVNQRSPYHSRSHRATFRSACSKSRKKSTEFLSSKLSRSSSGTLAIYRMV
jgi:hypothetical protein